MTLLPGELNSLDLVGAARRIAEGDTSPVELTAACLERIAALDASVNAFITVTADEAVHDAGLLATDVTRGDGSEDIRYAPKVRLRNW